MKIFKRTVLYNALIYTLDPAQPTASAIAIEGGRIMAAGEDAHLLREFGDGAERQDMGGRVLLPGLTDAHIHLETYALGLQKVDCETPTQTECLQRVAARAQNTPPGEWILGHGWNQNDWSEGFGSAQQLDRITPQHPVFLTAKSLHAAWANSAALRLAGITAETLDPQGGRIGRNEDGSPNGILFESAAWMIDDAIPEVSVEAAAQAIFDAQSVLWRMGLTGVHDFDQSRCFAALQSLHQRGELHLRVTKSIPLDLLPQAIELGLRTGFGDDFLRIGSVKAFADGALGPRTAAMLAPYEGEAENRGMLMLDAEELYEHGRQAAAHGLSLAVHAIGDRANHEVLNAFEHLRKDQATSISQATQASAKLRHRIEHVQLLHPDDANRLAALGVIASMQPIHATSDMYMADRYWGGRAALSYAWRTQLKHGAVLAFGSDAPVESPNPFWGLHAAVTRCRADGTPGPDGWYPEQRLTLLEALNGFTRGAAYAAGMEDRLGCLAPGYLADLLVLSIDPFACPPAQLHDLHPDATMVNGEWVFQA
jgi:predicted amidohydrolase YtcJ